jgi:hypothetical protein
MDHSSITSCIAWLAPVADKKMGGLNALYVSGDSIWATTPMQSAIAQQSCLPSDTPFAMPLNIAALVKWADVVDSALEKTRLVVKYSNGDTVKIPLLESGITEIELPLAYSTTEEHEWRKFPFTDALAHCAAAAEAEGNLASVHFTGMTMNATGRFFSRARKATTGVDYGNFVLPVDTANYIAKIGNRDTEIALAGECEWLDKSGAVIGHGPRSILVRNGENFVYISQLFTSPPMKWDVLWANIPCTYNCEMAEGISHYFTLIKSLSETGVAPAAVLTFHDTFVSVEAGDEIKGTVPVEYEDEKPPYAIKFQLSQWEEKRGPLSVSFGDTNAQPMTIHNGSGLDTAIMPMKL